MRVDVDRNQMILVLVKGNLERVKDEPYGRLFQSVKRHQLVLELFSKDFSDLAV